jgi:hypothetical protein
LLPTTTRITASETKKKGRVCYFSVDAIRYKIDQQPHHGPQNATRTTGTGETKKQDDQCQRNRSHPVKLHALPRRRATMGTIMQHRRDVFAPQARRCISSIFGGNAFTGGENEGCPMPQQTSHCPPRTATAFHFPAPCLMEVNAWTHNTQ